MWIELLRDTGSTACEELARLLVDPGHTIAVTEPVVMELLAGAPDAQALRALETLTGGLTMLAVQPAVDFHAGAAAYRAARAQGSTVRSLVDCLIAAVAVRTGAELVHRDADYDVLAATLADLRTRSLR